MDYKGRLQRVRIELCKNRVDAFLVTHLPNVRYLCGFSGSSGLLVVGERQNIFFTDGRYTEEAREEVQGARIKIKSGKSALAATMEWLSRQAGIRRLGIGRASCRERVEISVVAVSL